MIVGYCYEVYDPHCVRGHVESLSCPAKCSGDVRF